MKNKYIYHSQISEKKFRDILWHFSVDIEATKVAELTNVSNPTIDRIFGGIRGRIAEECERISPFDVGEIELDESYFGAKRVKGKPGRGAAGKTIVFGILQREGQVFTQVIKNCSTSTILPLVERMVNTGSTVYTDGFRTYDSLIDFGYQKHYRVNHSAGEFAKGRNHINGIESFWASAKVRLARFKGIHKTKFYLHLKECEFRFNNRKKSSKELYHLLLDLIRNYPIGVC